MIPASSFVDVYVRYLRQKLGTDRILTVRGAGYRLDNRPTASAGHEAMPAGATRQGPPYDAT